MILQGKNVVITGGAKRVGAALVRAFARQGACITIHCHDSEQEAQKLLQEIGGPEAGHSVRICDLSDPEQLEHLAPEILQKADLLINNASVFLRRKFREETLAESAKQWQINFTAPVRLMQIFAAIRPRGVVINMLDQGICRPDAVSFSYALSKKALADATKSAALQLAPEFRVCGIAPGPILPPVFLPASSMEKTLRKVPMGHPVHLNDLCNAAILLAENESMTGTILFIDGGQSLCREPE